MEQRIGGTIIEATEGGLASVAGGGKFENGAITTPFGYLFNDLICDAGSCYGSLVAGQRKGGVGFSIIGIKPVQIPGR